MNIKVINVENYLPLYFDKLNTVLNYLHKVINSVEFSSEIIAHSPFKTLNNLSNENIYSIIMAGKEIGTTPNNVVDLDLTMDYNYSSDVIGYTIDSKITTFSNMFEELSVYALAGHFAHEYCHTLGFTDPDFLSDTKNNVPYEVGRIVSKLASENNFSINFI